MCIGLYSTFPLNHNFSVTFVSRHIESKFELNGVEKSFAFSENFKPFSLYCETQNWIKTSVSSCFDNNLFPSKSKYPRLGSLPEMMAPDKNSMSVLLKSEYPSESDSRDLKPNVSLESSNKKDKVSVKTFSARLRTFRRGSLPEWTASARTYHVRFVHLCVAQLQNFQNWKSCIC